MANPIDLSELKNNAPEAPELTDEEAQVLADTYGKDFLSSDDGKADTAPTQQTAFLVLIDKDGTVNVEMDINNQNINRSRMPTPDDIIAACSVVINDISAQKAAQHTAFMLQQMQQAMMQQMQNSQIAAGLRL